MSSQLLLFIEQWGTWLDECLATGIAQLGESTCNKIAVWQDQATLLGFRVEAELSRTLTSVDYDQHQKADAFFQLSTRHELVHRFNNLHQIDIPFNENK